MKKVISNRFLAFALSIMLIFCLTPIYGLASDDPVESGETVEKTVDLENENAESGKVTEPAENNAPADTPTDTPADDPAPENNAQDQDKSVDQGDQGNQGHQGNDEEAGEITSESKNVVLKKSGGDDNNNDDSSDESGDLIEIEKVTLKFNSNGGSPVASITAKPGDPVTVPESPLREGYTFLGWDQPIPDTMPDSGMTFTANWEINIYVISFDTDGGSDVSPYAAEFGAVVAVPADPTKDGYRFDGWDQEIPETMPANDMEIKAKWIKLPSPVAAVDDDSDLITGIPTADTPTFIDSIPNVIDDPSNTNANGNGNEQPEYPIVHVVNDGTPNTLVRTVTETTKPILEDLAENEVPLASGHSGSEIGASWSPINVVCAVLTVLIAIMVLIRSRRDEEIDAAQGANTMIAGIAMITLLLTQDFTAEMVTFDAFTIPMMIIAAISAGIALFTRNRSAA